MMASLQRLKDKHKQTPVEREDRLMLLRVRNCILTLKFACIYMCVFLCVFMCFYVLFYVFIFFFYRMAERQITPQAIMRVVDASFVQEIEHPKDILNTEVMVTLLDHV